LGSVFVSIPPWLTVTTNPILFEFYFGLIAGFLFIEGHFLPRQAAIGAILLGIVILIVTGATNVEGFLRPLFWGIPCGLILLGAVSLERAGMKVPRLLVLLGDSSYTLYLVHPFVLPAFGKVWRTLHLSERAPPFVLGLTAFCCALCVGHGLYLLTEKPVTSWLSRRWKKSKPVFLKA
jgi:exopolysaccharide production protein ExoZ